MISFIGDIIEGGRQICQDNIVGIALWRRR